MEANHPVQLVSDPAIRGITTGASRTFASVDYLEIEVGPNDRKWVPMTDIIPLRAKKSGPLDTLANLEFGTVGDLIRVLIFNKISSNLSNVFYAMQASRTDFHSYQFKAVYKFIESFNNRILIADEVGLGKTIEAGLIWLETKARTNAQRLLVVCPPMLREKWKQELQFRFDTRTQIYDTKSLKELLLEFEQMGEAFQCSAICSLNTMRRDEIQELLEKLPTKFDLVIIDEAHHMRNSTTKSNAVGKLLSDFTEKMILLTATPIHLGSQDLFQLLHILDKDTFAERWYFDRLAEQNEPIIQAQSLIQAHPPKIEQAIEVLEEVHELSAFKTDPNFGRVLSKLKNFSMDNRKQLSEIGLLLEKLNVLGSHISRTRKREVKEWRVVREANSLNVKFSDEELEFYWAVTESVQSRVQQFGHDNIGAFALMMPQRQMASCIPAMVEAYRQDLTENLLPDEESLSEIGINNFEDISENQELVNWQELDSIVDTWPSSIVDSKFEILHRALQERFKMEPDVKIIIFSYFKKTLRYLSKRLVELGYLPTVIHGEIPMDERLELIEQFRTKPERRILLSSEVGSEGLDLQFCRILFNYDLPWNPMKVEQRIGRLDRIGQKGDKISIVNFAVEDTIEERILNRLYNRIGIFERSLGDLEPILGELTQELSFNLLSQRLSDEQKEEQIEQTLRAVENRRRHEEELVDQSSVFLGSADYILEQIEKAKSLGRRVTSEDIRRFIEDFFESSNKYYGTRVNWNTPEEGFASIKLSADAQSDLRTFCTNHNPPLLTQLTRTHPEGLKMALDGEIAQAHPKLEMLTHLHPLVRWIRDCRQQDEDAFTRTSAVKLRSEIVPSGDYLIAVQLWEFEGIKRTRRIEYGIASLNDPKSIEIEAEQLLQEIIDRGRTWEYADQIVESSKLKVALESVMQELGTRYQTDLQTFDGDNKSLNIRRRNHLESFYARQEDRLTRSIETMRSRHEPETKLRGFMAMLENRRRQKKEELAKLEDQSKVRGCFQDISVTLCRVIA